MGIKTIGIGIANYIINILYWLDEGVNTLLGGDPRETLSSRLGKTQNCRLCRFVCKILHVFDSRHCQRNIRQNVGNRTIWKWK